MTPLELSILLHYYSRGDDFETMHNPPQTEFIGHLVRNGILDERLSELPVYKITEKGIVYALGVLERAGSTPLPVWVIPQN